MVGDKNKDEKKHKNKNKYKNKNNYNNKSKTRAISRRTTNHPPILPPIW